MQYNNIYLYIGVNKLWFLTYTLYEPITKSIFYCRRNILPAVLVIRSLSIAAGIKGRYVDNQRQKIV